MKRQIAALLAAAALLLGIGGAAAFNLTLGKGDRATALYYVGNAATLLFSAGLVLWLQYVKSPVLGGA